jgi:colanic acid/amylovoran biosynthesis glycosyltransferase
MNRILYVAGSFYSRSETFRCDLVKGLSQSGHDVRVLCDSLDEDFNEELANITTVVRWLSLPSVLRRARFVLVRSTRGRMRRQVLDLFEGLRNRTLHNALAAQQFDVAFVDYGTVAVAALDVVRARSIPLIVHFHGFDATWALRDTAYAARLPLLFSFARALLTPSHHLKRLLILLGADPMKIHVVKHGVEANLLSPMPWSERMGNVPSVVFLGRLTPKKNPIALIEAFALVHKEMPSARLTIIGDGSERAKVEQRVHARGLGDSVRLVGSLPQHAALQEVNRHWVFAQHSVTPVTGDQESFGLSMAEAAALGLPVVTTLHNGIPEHVIDGRTGYLVREYDFEAMADKILFLLRNPSKAEIFGMAGRANVIDEYPPTARIDRVSSIIADVISKPVCL